jgi:uncharacterized protein (AIM24 family)
MDFPIVMIRKLKNYAHNKGIPMRQNEKILERILKVLVFEFIRDSCDSEFERAPLQTLLKEFELPAGAYERIKRRILKVVKVLNTAGTLEFPVLFQKIFDELNPHHHISEIDGVLLKLVKVFQLEHDFLQKHEALIFGLGKDSNDLPKATSYPVFKRKEEASTQKYEFKSHGGLAWVEVHLLGDSIIAEAGRLRYSLGNILTESTSGTVLNSLVALNAGQGIHRPTYHGTGKLVLQPSLGLFYDLVLNGECYILEKNAFWAADQSICLSSVINRQLQSELADEDGFQTSVTGIGSVILNAPGPVEIIDLCEERLVVEGDFVLARSKTLKHEFQKSYSSFWTHSEGGNRFVNIFQGSGRVYLAPIPTQALFQFEIRGQQTKS